MFGKEREFALLFICSVLISVVMPMHAAAKQIHIGIICRENENNHRREHVPIDYDLFLVNQFSSYLDSDISYDTVTEPYAINSLDQGKYDFLMSVPYRSEYGTKYLYVSQPYITVCRLLIAKCSNTTIYSGQTEQLNKKTVGILKSESYISDELELFAKANGIELHIIYYTNPSEMEKDFVTNKLE